MIEPPVLVGLRLPRWVWLAVAEFGGLVRQRCDGITQSVARDMGNLKRLDGGNEGCIQTRDPTCPPAAWCPCSPNVSPCTCALDDRGGLLLDQHLRSA